MKTDIGIISIRFFVCLREWSYMFFVRKMFYWSFERGFKVLYSVEEGRMNRSKRGAI